VRERDKEGGWGGEGEERGRGEEGEEGGGDGYMCISVFV
jgi:hypothetical protein